MQKTSSTHKSAAEGGHVWKTPKHARGSSKGAASPTRKALLTPMHFAVLLIVIMLGSGVFGMYQDLLDKRALVAQAYEQEYGYTNIDSVLSDTTTVTVIATGETKEVKVAKYRGAAILYDTHAQLEEKMAEVDAGTYEVLNAMEESK